MDDLILRPGPGIPAGVTIAQVWLSESFTRSPGPGGQAVNTSDTRVQLTVDVAGCTDLTDQQRRRVLRALADQLVDGTLRVTAHEHRSQHRNRVAARERAAMLLRDALAPPPPPRRATKPTRGSQRRRLQAKKQRGETKRLRGRVSGD